MLRQFTDAIDADITIHGAVEFADALLHFVDDHCQAETCPSGC